MNGPFSFGTPERQRFTMQFGYSVRPSFWQRVQSNAHLVIAAVGTAALLGVAAVALWLCIPGSGRQVAAASAEQAVPTIPVKTTKIAPVAAAVTVASAPQPARKADAVTPTTAAREASIPALASNSPRWTASNAQSPPAPTEDKPAPSKQASDTIPAQSTDTAFAEPAAENDASDALSQVAEPAPAGETAAKTPDDKMDGAQTAAIPEAKPQADPAATDDAAQPKPKPQKVGAAAGGRILRAVTMRSGPKKGAAAIVTVPAKASVQVMNCKQWCEIVYNGKHGWVYKSYVKTGA
ncbi:SH3 domain-containing protein [Mesorhizobium sp.]|uniref:SH3 domain-containing protein n=1 Tax=Mesorhizobium sp. TaxID=1871066 RepID=UPI000FE2BC8E|nr:SH3 domain-containing protein [Mesorhizobium sp.]RWH73329.1 MAG: SH3 domain-containing protein [Mesorhizobium sp.]RWL20586.1 MAG: SH3 domain-containing protein [Mesorhizobium sp.]RWL28715.1 MAG: SH3 domain-containing protein [Mesorhizobium sp.]RWL36395.1 MAG: SH3 domain-containing protein [Mesorhizobium sp.]RWL47033.1 MAG: SH3 domain-containing protein [Mesorhizobium sp.]